ncbi:tetratricopeptide repeat protein [Streptomyces soliscabiei]|uniref:tetratricopeptide repeat protein n=1 Tax=Streptomyces soliscabiei TaxID=588897 RepID=UPI0029AB99EF|nr:tetratricopeptide repeat protein [Streptomyces sp. NY05-11A]MDX2681879.1 tetratricopeptide repeat protein [Streptomyces sp. NY05-11A]
MPAALPVDANQVVPVDHLVSPVRSERAPHRALKTLYAEPSADFRPLALVDQAEATAWLETQYAGLLATQRLAADSGWYDVVWRMAWVLDTFHRRNGHLRAQLVAWRMGLAAARNLGDSEAEIFARRDLGIACIRSDLHDEALDHLHQALSLSKTYEDVAQTAHTLLVLAYAWERQENHEQALEHSRDALALLQTLEKPVWETQAHNQICPYCARLGHYEEARVHGETSLDLFRRHQERDGEADILGTLGRLAHQNGHHTLALTRFQQALALLREIGHAYEEANTQAHIGDVRHALSQHDQARQSWQQAADLYQVQHREDDAKQLRDKLRALKP